MVGTQIVSGVVLLISITQIFYIIRKHSGYNKMIDTRSVIIHGVLFCAYMGATTFWAIWNHASVELLTNNTKQLLIDQKLRDGYIAWLNSYFQCLLVFSWANCLV